MLHSSSTTIITGHTSGIGKYLYENMNCNVIGASRSNDRPIVDISEWFDDSCDLFINNAFDNDNPHAQSDALKYVYSKWKEDSNKMIISIGSNAPDWDSDSEYAFPSYDMGKSLLDKTNFDCYMESWGVKCSLIRPGFVDTPRIKDWWDGNKLTLNNILQVVNFIINFDGRIREITFENR